MTTPASSSRMIEKAADESRADVVILDLEDATAEGEKERARGVLVNSARALDWGKKVLAVRVNPVGSKWFERDVQEVVTGLDRLDVVVLPKVDSPEQVMEADRLLLQLERDSSRQQGSVALEVLVESPRAVVRLEEIAQASSRLEALIFGVADYAALAGARLTDDMFTDYMYAKQRIVAVARAFDLAPIDCVTFRYKDLKATRIDADRAARMGFEGKWCIHPGQVSVVNDAFTPSDEAVEWARRVTKGFEEGQKSGRGAVVVEGEMVDMATVRVARRILSTHARASLGT